MILPGLSKNVFTTCYLFWLIYCMNGERAPAVGFRDGLYTQRTCLAVFRVFVVVVMVVIGETCGVVT